MALKSYEYAGDVLQLPLRQTRGQRDWGQWLFLRIPCQQPHQHKGQGNFQDGQDQRAEDDITLCPWAYNQQAIPTGQTAHELWSMAPSPKLAEDKLIADWMGNQKMWVCQLPSSSSSPCQGLHSCGRLQNRSTPSSSNLWATTAQWTFTRKPHKRLA